MVNCINLIIEMSPRFILGRENVPCVAEVVNRSLKADCTDLYRAFCDPDLKAPSHPHPTTWASSKTHKAESDIVSPTIKSLLLVGNLQTVIV